MGLHNRFLVKKLRKEYTSKLTIKKFFPFVELKEISKHLCSIIFAEVLNFQCWYIFRSITRDVFGCRLNLKTYEFDGYPLPDRYRGYLTYSLQFSFYTLPKDLLKKQTVDKNKSKYQSWLHAWECHRPVHVSITKKI